MSKDTKLFEDKSDSKFNVSVYVCVVVFAVAGILDLFFFLLAAL